MIFAECLVVCFLVLLPCVLTIAYGPEQGAFLYEQDVQDRVVELGLLSKEKIARNQKHFYAGMMLPLLVFILWSVYDLNGARGFWTPFLQMLLLILTEGLFDRFFIDEFWVERTKAWEIPGTEDLKPYIPLKAKRQKWLSTMIGSPLIAAVLAAVMLLFVR